MKGVRRQLTSVGVKCVPLDTSGIQLWKKSISFLPFKDTHINIRQGLAQYPLSQVSYGSKSWLEVSCWSFQTCLPVSCWENVSDNIHHCLKFFFFLIPATVRVRVWETRRLKAVYLFSDSLPAIKFNNLVW